jgi:hypothetical protein
MHFGQLGVVPQSQFSAPGRKSGFRRAFGLWPCPAARTCASHWRTSLHHRHIGFELVQADPVAPPERLTAARDAFAATLAAAAAARRQALLMSIHPRYVHTVCSHEVYMRIVQQPRCNHRWCFQMSIRPSQASHIIYNHELPKRACCMDENQLHGQTPLLRAMLNVLLPPVSQVSRCRVPDRPPASCAVGGDHGRQLAFGYVHMHNHYRAASRCGA